MQPRASVVSLVECFAHTLSPARQTEGETGRRLHTSPPFPFPPPPSTPLTLVGAECCQSQCGQRDIRPCHGSRPLTFSPPRPPFGFLYIVYLHKPCIQCTLMVLVALVLLCFSGNGQFCVLPFGELQCSLGGGVANKTRTWLCEGRSLFF